MSSRKFRVWLNSGANIHSCREVTMTLDDLNITSKEWDEMSESERDEVMREVAFERSDWGFREITDE